MPQDPRPPAQSMATLWYRQALQRHSKSIVEILCPQEIRVSLLSIGIISVKQREQLQRENVNNGNMAENEKLLDVLLNKEEAKLKAFVYILTNHSKDAHKSLGKLINATYTDIASGKDNSDDSELKAIVENLKSRYHAEDFRVAYPVPDDDSLRIDVGDIKRILYYKCKAQMLNQKRLEELKAKTDPKYIIPEYDDLKVERIEEVLQPMETLVKLKTELSKSMHRRRASVILSPKPENLALAQLVSSASHSKHGITRSKSASFLTEHYVSTFKNESQLGGSLPHTRRENTPIKESDNLPILKVTSPNDLRPEPQEERMSGVKCTILQKDESTDSSLETLGPSHESTEIKTRLYLCTGDAGMGKTTLLKRLGYKWTMQQSKSMLHFSVVLVIRLRSANFDRPLAEVIESVGLLSRDDAEWLMVFLNNPQNASKVLFMLDGCDEVKISPDSDLSHLIEGSLFPGTHIFVTARPDTPTYKTLYQLHPFALVTMEGTEPESIRHYLKTNLKLNTAAIENMLEKNIFDLDILSKPLYLTLFCAMYDKDVPIEIPDSNTDLFNGFMKMIIKREIQRYQSRRNVSCNTKFDKSPLEPESEIPSDIKHNIYFVGKMAYEGLLENKQTFTQGDLHEYMLTGQVLTYTGLFCFGKDEHKQQTAFFRHKLMQEYMAALYIAKEGFKIHSLFEMIEEASRSQRPTLQSIFAKVQLPIMMACGLSVSFYKELLRKAKPFTSITKDKFQECNIQAQFEFSLCFEAGCKNEDVAKEMEQYMLDVPIIEHDIDGHEPVSWYHKKCVTVVTGQFSHETCKQLLMKWFDINTAINTRSLSSNAARLLSLLSVDDQRGYHAEHTAHSFDICGGIGLVCMSMLSQFSFQDVTTLKIRGEKGTVNIQRLFVIFPRLKDIDIWVNFPIDLPHDLELKQRLDNGQYCKSVRKFTQKARTHMKWQLQSISCLISQLELQFLSLYGIDILSNIPDGLPCKWSNLSTLKMVWCGITKKKTPKVVNILKHTPQLKLLDLSENQGLEIDTLAATEMNQLSTLNLTNVGLAQENTGKLYALFKNTKNVRSLNLSENKDLDVNTLCQAIIKHLHDLEELKLFQSLNHDSCTQLAEYLPKLKSLKRLGIYSRDIGNAEEKLVEKLLEMQNIEELEIQVAEWAYDTCLSVHLKQELQKKNIKVFELDPQ